MKFNGFILTAYDYPSNHQPPSATRSLGLNRIEKPINLENKIDKFSFEFSEQRTSLTVSNC